MYGSSQKKWFVKGLKLGAYFPKFKKERVRGEEDSMARITASSNRR